MDPNTVFALLLDRPATTCIEDGKLTLWVEALDAAADRRRQEALVGVFNKLALRCRGSVVTTQLRQIHGKRDADGYRGESRIPAKGSREPDRAA